MSVERQTHIQRPCFIPGAFSDAELAQFDAVTSRCPTTPATLITEGGENAEGIRRGTVAWVKRNDESAPLYAALSVAAARVNEAAFAFELHGMAEDLQMAIYGEGDCFGWHIDASPQAPTLRKLSLSIQLSDPGDYEGGDFEIAWTGDPIKAPRDRGTLIAFPSYIPHRVTSVRKGTRRALVCWITGPQLR